MMSLTRMKVGSGSMSRSPRHRGSLWVWSIAVSLMATTTRSYLLIATTLISLDLISFPLSTKDNVTSLIKRLAICILTRKRNLGV